MIKKRVGLYAALEEYQGAASHLENTIEYYKNLPAEIQRKEQELAALVAEIKTGCAALSKPLDEYSTHWEGFIRVPIHKDARRLFFMGGRADSLDVEIKTMRAQKSEGARAYTESARREAKNAGNRLFNAANVAAARMKIKPPLCANWERLSLDQIMERIKPLAIAESTWLEESKVKKSKRKPADEGEVREVSYKLENGGAVLIPSDLYKAVKGASTAQRDYILIGRGVLLPAKTLVDWLRLVADEPSRLWLGMDGKSGGDVVSLKAKIDKTIAEFIGFAYEAFVNKSNDNTGPFGRGGPLLIDNNMMRCSWRVNLVRAA
jgi:hypothetical protein